MLLHSDGFDSHAAAGTLSAGDPGWGAQTGVVVTAAAGRFSGNALRLPANTSGGAALVVAPTGRLAVAGWFKATTLASAVLLRDTAGPLLSLAADGSLVVRDGAGTIRITSAAALVSAASFAWVEVSYRTGQINLTVAGVPAGVYTGAYTDPDEASLQVLASGGTNPELFLDDLIVWDDAGSFFNTFAVAPRRIQLLRPTADGTPVQWTPNGATNWQSADAADWAGGAGNVATANGQKDRYGFSDLAAAPGSIDAVTVKTRVENTGTDPATLAHVVGQGVAETASTPQSIAGTPGVLRSNFYRDTAAAVWTASTVNAAEFGQQLGT